MFDEHKDGASLDDSLTKIPVAVKTTKVKTIKKHSKDPLKEFVTLSKDVNWDDDEETSKIMSSVTTDPIVKTTVTRITTETITEPKSKIPVLLPEALNTSNNSEKSESENTPKSKIPVLKTETTCITSPETTVVEKTIISPDSTTKVVETTTTTISPGSKTSLNTADSDSEEDSRRSPPLKGILKKNSVRTIGSSSGSDIALHEEGAELSEDDSGMLNVKYLY